METISNVKLLHLRFRLQGLHQRLLRIRIVQLRWEESGKEVFTSSPIEKDWDTIRMAQEMVVIEPQLIERKVDLSFLIWPTLLTLIGGFMSRGKDFSTRIQREAKHSYRQTTPIQDKSMHQRFRRSFLFSAPEPLYLEFSCKFASSDSSMMIGFAYVTRDFFCFCGANGKDR